MEEMKDSRGIWLYLFLVVFALLVLVLVLVVLYSVGILPPNGSEPTLTPTATLTPKPEPKPTEIITGPGVLKRIESTMILQTTVFRIDTVVRAKKEGSWFLNFGGENLLLFVKGTVTAGVDLGELDEDSIDVSQETKTIVITLPQAKVLNAILDKYEIENYKGEKPDRVDLDLLKEGLEAGRVQIANTACESEILERATVDAQHTYGQMMSFVDLLDYEVVIKTTPITDCSIEVTSSQTVP